MIGKPRGRNGGRKPLPAGERKETASIRLLPRHAAKLRALGAAQIGRMLDETTIKPEPPKTPRIAVSTGASHMNKDGSETKRRGRPRKVIIGDVRLDPATILALDKSCQESIKPKGYRMVPSTGAITREEAIAYSIEEWPNDTEYLGIEWKGNAGRHTMLWTEIRKG